LLGLTLDGEGDLDTDDLTEEFRKLDSLAKDEYRLSLADIFTDSDTHKTAERLVRLVGVLIKEPFADPQVLASPSARTGAYRTWLLKTRDAFNGVAATDPPQYELLKEFAKEYIFAEGFSDKEKIYRVAHDAQHESGFFSLYAVLLRRYICGDKEVRKKFDDAFKGFASMGGPKKAPTPEGLVGASGLALGVYLVQTLPALGMAGAPAIAAVVLIIYKLGVETFCEWSKDVSKEIEP
jgi:hypothetical protein